MDTQATEQALRAKIEELKKALPCISFGYLGNYEFGKDYTSWYIFLPHYGRVGQYSDSVSIGSGTDKEKFTKALANWDRIEAGCRRQYAADPNRICAAKLSDRGNIVEAATGVLVSLGINPPPIFNTVEEAKEYVRHYNTPVVVR